MPIYTEVMSDEQILEMLPAQCCNIFIVGCGACTNESLAYKNDVPIFKDCTDVLYPYATRMELRRITKMLQKKGFSVEYKYFDDIGRFLCMNNSEQNNYSLEWKKSPDVICCMCCNSGYSAIKKAISSIPIRIISQIKGVISYSFKDIDNSRIIVKEQSIVIPINKGGDTDA